MSTGKTYSTKYLLDSNNSSGVAGQVLVTTATGVNWQDAESTGDNQTQGSLFDSKIVLIDTPNGGLKPYRVITDEYGEWIQVGRFAASAMTTIQSVWSSVSGLSTGTAQSETTQFSADFGDCFPDEVRIMGATDFDNWRNTRTIDWVYKVPPGRKWKFFFSNGETTGMGVVDAVKYGWTVNGAYDGFGRWTNPNLVSVRMSDTSNAIINTSAAYTTATANAFNWETNSDAKFSVSATRTFCGQDTFVTSGVGNDDNVQGFFDEYPSETNNMQGGVDFSSAVWVLIKVPGGASGGGGDDAYWSANGNDIHNDNTGNVGIGTTSPGNHKLNVHMNQSYGSFGPSTGFNVTNETTNLDAGFITVSARYNNPSPPNLYYKTGGIGGGKETAAGNSQWGGYLSFWTTSDGTAGAASGMFEHMRITADGNVGINTTDPGAKLEINSGISSSSIDVIKISQATNGAIKDAASLGVSIQNGGEATNAADLWFQTATGGSLSLKMIVKSAGNVGINSTNPLAKLHVEGDKSYSLGYLDATSDLHIGNDTMSSAVGAYSGSITFGSTNESNLQAASIVAVQTDTDPNEIGLAFFTQHSSAGSTDLLESMRIKNDGNVGIGEDNPTEKLHLQSTTSGCFIRFADDTADGVYVGSRADALEIYAGNTERMRVTSVGNVGIGDTSPTSISANTSSITVNSTRADLSGGYITKANGTVAHQMYWDTTGFRFDLSPSSGDFNFKVGNTDKVRISKEGNISTPKQELTSTAIHTNKGLYTTEIRLIDTPNGGLKQCRVITDNYGEWILVGRFAANARANIQSTWSSESGLDTSTAQNNVTRFSADFGDSLPSEVRVMGSTDFDRWRDNRTIDFIYGVPEGRKWKYFFSGGVENGMIQSGKFGWGINGAYDGFGRWVNPAQNFVRMSDGQVDNPSAAYTTATTNAFNWNTASDAKMSVSATRVFSGQDTFLTSGFGVDDSLSGFFDDYPSEVTNMQGGDDFSSAVWVLIKLPKGISSGGGDTDYWVADGNNIHNNNTGIVNIKGPSATAANGNQTLSIQNTTGGTVMNLGTAENSYGWIEAREGATLRNLLLSPNGGNVGIGLTNPSSKLTIETPAGVGTIELLAVNAANTKNKIIFSEAIVGDESFFIEHDGAGAGADNLLKIHGDGSGGTASGITIRRDGRVGIGNNNPAKPLDVEGIIRARNDNSGDHLDIYCDGDVSGDSILENTNSSIALIAANGLTKIKGSGEVTTDGSLEVHNSIGAVCKLNSNGDSFINGGKLGVGITLPQYKLDVAGQIRAQGIVNIGGLGVAASGALANVDINDTDVNGTSTTYQSNITFKSAGTVKGKIGKLSNSTNYFTAAKNFDGPVNIIAAVGGGAEYKFGYEPANNVDTFGLNLVDSVSTPNSLYVSATGNNNSSIFFGGYINALCVTRISLNQTLGTWLFDSPDCGTSRVSVKWRQYNSGGYMQNMIDFEDDGDIKNINGSYGTISSDERVKENIVEATSKLNDILSLKVKNFNFIGDNKKQIGLIAQEVEEVFPSWVNTRDTRIYKTHDEDGNTLKEQGELVSGHEDGKSLKVGMEFAILTKAIQEQQEIIQSLKQRIEQLEN